MPEKPDFVAEAAFARHLVRQRRKRETILGDTLFGEPAWDMLLELFASTVESRNVAVSSLVASAAVPDSTAHRRLVTLAEAGMVTRVPDGDDGRRTFVRLEDDTFHRLADVLRTSLTETKRHLRE